MVLLGRMPAEAHRDAGQRITTVEQGPIMSNEHWEIRRALRYGSERVKIVRGLDAAKTFAQDDIAANGDEGRIKLIDRDKRILYYDIYPEMT
jgi:hypothetical protein